MRRAYNDISASADIPPATRKPSGQENDRGAWKGRGMICNRREGRTENLEPVERVGGLGVYHGITCLVFPKPCSSGFWGPLEADWSLICSRLRGLSANESERRPNNGCGRDILLEGPGSLNPSESGKSEATLRDSNE